MYKKIGWFFVLAIGLCACTTASPPDPAPPSTPELDPVILTTVPSRQPTATAKFVPKHNDLIFVEFFAVT